MPSTTTNDEDFIKRNEFDSSLQDYASNDEIRLTIIVGDGQLGYSNFRNINGEIQAGDIVNKLINLKKNAVGKSILCISVVTDTRNDTDRTSVTYYINGVKQRTYSYDVVKDHGTLIYYTTINFVA